MEGSKAPSMPALDAPGDPWSALVTPTATLNQGSLFSSPDAAPAVSMNNIAPETRNKTAFIFANSFVFMIQGDDASEYALISDGNSEPSSVVHLPPDRAHGRETGSAQQIEQQERPGAQSREAGGA